MVYLLLDHAHFGHIALAVGLAEVGAKRFEYQPLVVAYQRAEVYEQLPPKRDIAGLSGGEELALRGDDFIQRRVLAVVFAYRRRIGCFFHISDHGYGHRSAARAFPLYSL